MDPTELLHGVADFFLFMPADQLQAVLAFSATGLAIVAATFPMRSVNLNDRAKWWQGLCWREENSPTFKVAPVPFNLLFRFVRHFWMKLQRGPSFGPKPKKPGPSYEDTYGLKEMPVFEPAPMPVFKETPISEVLREQHQAVKADELRVTKECLDEARAERKKAQEGLQTWQGNFYKKRDECRALVKQAAEHNTQNGRTIRRLNEELAHARTTDSEGLTRAANKERSTNIRLGELERMVHQARMERDSAMQGVTASTRNMRQAAAELDTLKAQVDRMAGTMKAQRGQLDQAHKSKRRANKRANAVQEMWTKRIGQEVAAQVDAKVGPEPHPAQPMGNMAGPGTAAELQAKAMRSVARKCREAGCPGEAAQWDQKAYTLERVVADHAKATAKSQRGEAIANSFPIYMKARTDAENAMRAEMAARREVLEGKIRHGSDDVWEREMRRG